MIKIYGMPTCPYCDYIHEQVKGREDEFQYINIGRPLTDTDNVAQVKMIVPHTQGQAYAQQNVYPCFYRLTLVKSAVEEDAEK